ncbi:MAG: hypothetical protein HN742_25700 [Lentisphaerae bacterium]|jgi:hypothetical protein|nr:hypothetical protein [Lentisphaerota bacterium]MBT4822086.1 hypothetical protein [Lentisphaerota bacterium]MBT5608027.1 hypothetical protein [Lentisphaerota bacterium]MBT7056031.1 hypothetical protein [Lentisphaerota bacterium]MBT7845295.1 hypothetical protein [Lentisphaerota bacterium]
MSTATVYTWASALLLCAAHATPLFTENFNTEVATGRRDSQAQSGLPITVTGAVMPGWTRQGAGMPSHFVERAPGDWALMVIAQTAGQNVFTLNKGVAANDRDHIYFVTFDTSPAVYEALSQTTAADDQLAVELIRPDGTVLASNAVKPGKWAGETVFASHAFSYTGDGSGPLRLRIFPVFTSGTRFYGAIDNLQVFGSAAEAEAALQQRVLAVRRAREAFLREQKELAQLLARCTPLERDWLLQAGNKPTVARALQEITWARELATRLSQQAPKPSLSAELRELVELEARSKTGGLDVSELYLAVRRVKRAIFLKNPAVDFSGVLLVDNPYPQDRHESGHRHGYRAGSGKGKLLVLEGLSPDSRVRSLVPEDNAGFLWRPDVSFDASKIVFCLMPEGDTSFHLHEVNVDGTGFRQLTFGDYDDLDPIFLPDGKLLFTTTRAHTYVRCGPTHHSPVLARCDSNGKNIYVISRNSEPDYLPTLLPDGRIMYTRWEYTDKEQQRVQSLWTMNPDGTGVAAFWGNQSVWPDMLVEPRPIPGSNRIMFTGVGHHMWFEGSIGIIDPAKGMNYPHGITKVTAEIRWPEVGNGPAERAETNAYCPAPYPAYKTPYPIGPEDFLVSILHPNTKRFSLYLMDLSGNRELIYTGQHNVWHAVPLTPRPRPPVIPNQVAWPPIGADQPPLEDGVMYSASVFEGDPLLPRDKVRYLRVLHIEAKTYTPWKKTFGPSGPAISISQADGVKRIMGTTPVESDGSICFKAPPGKALHFQLLDKDFRCIQTMRSFTGVMPGETRGCVGCHEGRRSTPVDTEGGAAMRRGPLALTPTPWGADVSIGYERFVQPVLDTYCGRCHQGDGRARGKLDLTWRKATTVAARTGRTVEDFNEPYVTLMGGGATWFRAVGKQLTNNHGLPVAMSGCLLVEGFGGRNPAALATLKPMTHLSSASLLIDKAMDEKHLGRKMDADSLRRLVSWVDANGPYLGEEEIRQMPDPTPRTRWPRPVPVVQPRLKTAPRINRFNIRQDGDSTKVLLAGAPATTDEQASGSSAAVGHPFVICDIHKKQIMKVDAAGEVVWTYPGERVHDLWVLPSGNVLFAGPKTGVVEVTPGKKEVWTYRAGKGEAILSCQPLPNGNVLVGIQAKPSRIIEVGRDGTVHRTIPLQTKGAIRLARKTHTGTYIVAERAESSIHEYDREGRLIRRIASQGAVFMAARLKNGNTLIGTGTGHTLVEVDPNDRVVWQVGENDLPSIPIRDAAGFQRLPNGNTVLCNWGGHGHIGKQAQIVEITPDKKVVWQIYDNEKFTTPLHIQLLDVPGDSAKGELVR